MFNPRAVRRKIDEAAGGRRWPASFADRLTHPVPTLWDAVTLAREGGFATDLSDVDRIPIMRGDLPRVAADQTAVTWVGHATYVVQLGGLVILTDPVWSRRIAGARSRLTPPGVAFADLPRVDAVVISHNHYDHLDAPTVRQLPRATPLLVPAALGGWFRRRGFRVVTELDWWESTEVGGVRFDFVPAHHWSRRTLVDTCETLWGGWVMTGPTGATVYFAGDTGYGPFFAEIGARYPGIDLALLPVGAYEPRWFMRALHTDPAEAVRACGELGAARMATMHWGTFMLSAEPLLAPVERARAHWQAAGHPRDALWDLAVGESRVVE